MTVKANILTYITALGTQTDAVIADESHPCGNTSAREAAQTAHKAAITALYTYVNTYYGT